MALAVQVIRRTNTLTFEVVDLRHAQEVVGQLDPGDVWTVLETTGSSEETQTVATGTGPNWSGSTR